MSPVLNSPTPNASGKAVFGVGVGAVAAGLLMLYFRDPHVQGAYPPCPFHFLTGYWCPGCGITRGINDVMHGRFVQGFWQNPLLMLFLPAAIFWGGRSAWRVLVDPTAPAIVVKDRLLRIGLLLVVVYWLLRNLPWWPFSLLAPG